MMIMHGKAVRRGVSKSLLVVDMPIGTYEKNPKLALKNAKKIIKETNCDAVKVEGGEPRRTGPSRTTSQDVPLKGQSAVGALGTPQ